MAGHIKTRRDARARVRYQARIPSPTNRRKDIVKTFDRRREADRWLARQASAIEEGSYIDPRRGKRPLREIVDAWRESWADLEPKTKAG